MQEGGWVTLREGGGARTSCRKVDGSCLEEGVVLEGNGTRLAHTHTCRNMRPYLLLFHSNSTFRRDTNRQN